MCSFHNKGGLTSKYCKSNTLCILNPKFGYEKNKPLYCKSHASEDMIDVRNKKCKFAGCNVQPRFGLVGESPDFCIQHKTEEMIDLIHKKCIYPECDLRARYEYLGETVPKYCSEHKLEDMIDIERTKCGYKGCETFPVYGLENETIRYCKIHKFPEMKNLRGKKCSFPGCEIRASFGDKGESPEYCKKHMESQMIDIYNKKCLFEGCVKRASFGLPGGELLYCYSHKLDSMINIKREKCLINSCETIPTYGYLFSKTNNHCLEHSTLNEYNKTKRFPRCSDLYCPDPALFIDYEDKLLQPIRCINHKKETDIEIVEKICVRCYNKLYIPNNKDICADCGNYRCIIINRRENEIKMLLKNNNISFIHNKPVHLDGSLKRPDFLINSIFGKIVVECDEFQHKNHDNDHEEKRMKIIYNDIQLLSSDYEVLFIRYNPDNYKGIQHDNSYRLEYLHFLLNHFIKLDKLYVKLGVLYLFYNGFEDNPQIQEIKIDIQ